MCRRLAFVAFSLVAASAIASAQNPVRIVSGEKAGGRRPPSVRQVFHLLKDEYLCSELDLSAEQEAAIEAARDEYDTKYQRLRDQARLDCGAPDDPDMAFDDEAERIREREINREFSRSFRDSREAFERIMEQAVGVLTEEQAARLVRLDEQRRRVMGILGRLWPIVTKKGQEKVGLSRSEVRQIEAIVEEALGESDGMRETIRAAHRDLPAEGRREALMALYREHVTQRKALADRTRDRIFDVLTEAQREAAEKAFGAGKREAGGAAQAAPDVHVITSKDGRSAAVITTTSGGVIVTTDDGEHEVNATSIAIEVSE